MVTVAIFAIIAAISVPSMAGMIDREKVGAASDSLVRAVQQAKAHSIQTGKRTELLINGSSVSNCGNANVAWVIREEGVTDTAISCVTSADFSKRFNGSTLTPKPLTPNDQENLEQSIVFTPLGIANNDDILTYAASGGDRTKLVDIYPGGAVVPRQCANGAGTAVSQDC